MIVCKFGGTSVADAGAIRRAAEIIRGRLDRRPVVVVSALAGTTNALLSAAEQAASGNLVAAIATVEASRARHMTAVAELLGDDDAAGEIAADESVMFDELAHLMEALSVLGHVTDRSLDAISSMGEQLSAPVITAAFVRAGIDAVLVDSRDVMITDAQFGRAEPQPEAIAAACRERVAPLVNAGKVPVMAGYLGSTMQGVTTTLGRGGSDYSASLLGAALEAQAIEIWTDVDGMLTADPRVVDSPRLIEHIRFDEAAELASFGAKVLHPNTIAPAVRLGIPVYVLNSLNPSGRGTKITFDAPRMPVRAIAAKGNTVIVKVGSTRMVATPGVLRAIFDVFERNRISVDVVTTSEVSVSVTLDEDKHLDVVVGQLREFGDVGVERGRAIIAVVGAGLGDSSAAMAKALAAIGDVRLHMVSLSATGINLTLIVDGDDMKPVMRRLHDAFFGAGAAA
jgi:aspartate kinase